MTVRCLFVRKCGCTISDRPYRCGCIFGRVATSASTRQPTCWSCTNNTRSPSFTHVVSGAGPSRADITSRTPTALGSLTACGVP